MPLRWSESIAMDGANHMHALSPRLKISVEIRKPLKLPWTMLFSSCSVALVAPFGTAVPLKGKLSRCVRWQSWLLCSATQVMFQTDQHKIHPGFPHPPTLSLVLFNADCLLQERRNSPKINLEKLLRCWRGRRREGKRTSVYVCTCIQRCCVPVLVLSILCKQPLL